MTRKSVDLKATAESAGRRAAETGDKAETVLRMQGLAPQQLAETFGDVTRHSGQEFARNTRRSRKKLVKAARHGGAEVSHSAQEAAQELANIAAEVQQQAGRIIERARADTATHAAHARRRKQWRRWGVWLLAAAVLGAAAAVVYSRTRAVSQESGQRDDIDSGTATT